jgi:hypothetical protein
LLKEGVEYNPLSGVIILGDFPSAGRVYITQLVLYDSPTHIDLLSGLQSKI